MMLIVWEIIPSDVNCYSVPQDSEVAGWARECAGKYINAGDIDDNHPIWKLNDWLATVGALDYLVDNDKVISGTFHEIVICGHIV